MEGSRISSVGAALADPSRGEILGALASGRAHTAGELARWLGLAPSTTSGHLSKLIDAGLVLVEPSGRHRYYRIASEEVAELFSGLVTSELLEQRDGLVLVTDAGSERFAMLGIETDGLGKQRRPLTRQCLDWTQRKHHLGGALGAALFDQMQTLGWLRRGRDHRVVKLTEAGQEALREQFGMAVSRS